MMRRDRNHGSSDERVRLVSFIGTGGYSSVNYTFSDRQREETCFVALALAQFVKPVEIVILSTDEAKAKHGESLFSGLRDHGHPNPEFREIPAGKSPDELWKQFDTIKESIRGFDGRVALDITHGFRAQPFFAAAVTAFVKAVDPNPPKLNVYYAFADKDTSEAPIWDLSPFVSLLEWSQALSIFLKTGRANEAAAATEALGSMLRKVWAEAGQQGSQPTVQELGKALRAFGNDLQTLRTGHLLLARGKKPSSSRSLLDSISASQPQIKQHIPPLGDVLERIKTMVEPLAKERTELSEKLEDRAVADLAKLYLKLGRYIEAIATVREGYINRFAAPEALVPAHENFSKDQRRVAEKAISSDQFYREVADRRNDILHAQYREFSASQNSTEMIETIERIIDKFAALEPRTASHAATSHQNGRKLWFLNISNHPSCEWSREQTKAAQDLAPQIRDIPFPDVPPDADEQAVADLARRCLSSVPDDVLASTSHALVQGEFTLAVEIVKRLQQHRIVCLAAASSRDTADLPDGLKLSRFGFERFRRFPSLVAGPSGGETIA